MSFFERYQHPMSWCWYQFVKFTVQDQHDQGGTTLSTFNLIAGQYVTISTTSSKLRAHNECTVPLISIETNAVLSEKSRTTVA